MNLSALPEHVVRAIDAALRYGDSAANTICAGDYKWAGYITAIKRSAQ